MYICMYVRIGMYSLRKCLLLIRSRFSVVFLCSITNTELVELHASNAALPMLTSKFPLMYISKYYIEFHYAALPSYNKINSDHMHYLNQKDEQALPANFQNRRYSFGPHFLCVLSLSLFLQSL
jgi:hypothetical protein